MQCGGDTSLSFAILPVSNVTNKSMDTVLSPEAQPARPSPQGASNFTESCPGCRQSASESDWCSETLPCCDADARCESLLGGSGAKCVKQSSGSMDTPDWNNGFQWCSYEVPQDSGTKYCTSEGWTCEGYEWKGWCKDGRVYYGGGAEFNYPENNCCACGKQCGGDTSLSFAILSVSNVSNKSMDTVLSPEAQPARPSPQGASNFTESCPGCRQCASESDWCSETLPCCDADSRCESLLGGSGAKCVKQSSGCVAEGAICGGHGMLTQQCCGDQQCQWQGDEMRCGVFTATLFVSNVSSKPMDAVLSPKDQPAHPSLQGANNFTEACPGCRQCASENDWCSETQPCCDADARCESFVGGSGAKCVKQSFQCASENDWCSETQPCCDAEARCESFVGGSG